jgi:hypothetical protein
MPLRTSLTDLDLVAMNGALWRAAVVGGRLGAVTLRCAVAHALPGGAPAGTVQLLPATAQNR